MTKRKSHLKGQRAHAGGVPPAPSLPASVLAGLESLVPPLIPSAASEQARATRETGAGQAQQLLHKLEALESAQAACATRLEHLEGQVRQDVRAVIVELGALRTELVGDRKSLTALNVFNVVIPVLDSLHAMESVLVADKDSAIYRQVDALVASLSMMLRTLGFTEFGATTGEPFDPVRMEWAGFAQGERGVVLGLVRAGYCTPVGVVRPAGVLLADPNSEPSNE